MSRKQAPRWDHPRFQDIFGRTDRNPFSRTDAEKLASAAGCKTQADIEKFADLAIEVGANIRALRWINDKVPPSQINAALRKLRTQAETLEKMLNGTDDGTLGRIRNAYPSAPLNHEWDLTLAQAFLNNRGFNLSQSAQFLSRDLVHLQRLTSAIGRAQSQLQPRAGAGRPGLPFLNAAARTLAVNVWEPVKGPFQISKKRGRDHAAEFLRQALQILEPGVQRPALETALRHALTFSKGLRKQSGKREKRKSTP
jgi:hypothetical protein